MGSQTAIVITVNILQMLIYSAYASPIDNDEDSSSTWSHIIAGILSIAGLLCLVKLITLCAEICQKRTVYKEFDDPEDVFNPDLNPSSPVASDFSMYPPVENTPDTVVNTTSVVFEPLPDITQIRPTQPEVANTIQLRPKVAIVPGDHENDDDFEDIMAMYDPSQDKMKLHNLISNTRNQVPREQISYIKELGSGWFGKVLQGEGHRILPGHKKTKIVVQMLKEDATPSDQLAFLQEATPYREVDHASVLKMLGQCVETAPYLTVLELCPFGDLKTYLRSHRVAMNSFNEKGLLLKFASDIAAGLQALHDVNFVHRDFAARNCSLSSDLTVKIGDYGLAEEMYKEDYYFDESGCGVPIRWLAPECVLVHDDGQIGLRYITKSCNIWSFGVTLWEILTFGNLPYSDLSNEHIIRLVIKERSLKLNKPDVNVTHLDRLYELMQLCWSTPNSRPSLRQLRIMLLHLLSNKINTHNSTAFEEKWNKLLPRKAPQVVPVTSTGVSGFEDALVASPKTDSLNNGTRPLPHLVNGSAIKTVSNNEIGAVPYNEPVPLHEPSFTNTNINIRNDPKFTTNGGGDSVAKLDASKLQNIEEDDDGVVTSEYDAVTAVGGGPRDGLSLEAELAQVHRTKEESYTTPINELSLAAELGDFQNDIASGESTPVNDSSLQHVIMAPGREPVFSSSVDSQTKDEIMILDSMGELVSSQSENSSSPEKAPKRVTPPPDLIKIKINDRSTADTPGRSDSIISAAKSVGSGLGPFGTSTPAREISTSHIMSPADEFEGLITSTPVKKSHPDLVLHLHQSNQQLGTPGGSTTAFLSTTSGLQGDSDYHTALSSQIHSDSSNSVSTSTTPPTAGSITSTEDDRSFLGQKKFAAMLQTVVTSFDNEDAELYSSSFGEMSFEAIPEEHETQEDSAEKVNLVVEDQLREDDSITPTDDHQKRSSDIDIDILSEPEGTGDDTFIIDDCDNRSEKSDTSPVIDKENNAKLPSNDSAVVDVGSNADISSMSEQFETSQSHLIAKQDNLKDVVENILGIEEESIEGESSPSVLQEDGGISAGVVMDGNNEDSFNTSNSGKVDVSQIADTSQSPLMTEGSSTTNGHS